VKCIALEATNKIGLHVGFFSLLSLLTLETEVSGTQVTGHSLQVIAGLIITGLEEMESASETFLHS
jgi:hypothetical protein